MKRSISKKETFEDKFGRKYYTRKSAARQIKFEKHANNKKFRRGFNPDKEDSE